jgi:hypothetical protein
MLVVNPDHTICVAGEQQGAFPVRIRTLAAGTYIDDDVRIRVTAVEDDIRPSMHTVHELEHGHQPVDRLRYCYRHVGGLACFVGCLVISYTLWMSQTYNN